MLAAEGDIVGLFHRDLLALGDGAAVGLAAQVHGCLATAMADGANLAQMIGQGQKLCRSGEERAAKIRAQAVAQDRQPELVDYAGQVTDLAGGEELGFIEENSIERRSPGLRLDRCKRSVSGAKIRAGAFKPIRDSIWPVRAPGSAAWWTEVHSMADMPRSP